MELKKETLRDIMETTIAKNKQSLYFMGGTLFSSMGYALITADNKNYSAITFLMIIGILFYSFIMCNNIQFEDDNVVVHDRKNYDVVDDEEEDEYEKNIESLEEKKEKLSAFTLEEKVAATKFLIEQLCSVTMEDDTIYDILDYITDLADRNYATAINEEAEEIEPGEVQESSPGDAEAGPGEVQESSPGDAEAGPGEVQESSEDILGNIAENIQDESIDLQKIIEAEINEEIHEKAE
jgi:hypothetical protein